MIEQLIKRNCSTGESQALYPETSFNAVFDHDTGKTLDESIQNLNHLYLSLIGNSKKYTRLSIPPKYRRTGLWITYTSCKGNIVTEIYKGASFDDESWGSSDNWIGYMDEKIILQEVNKVLSWYKS